MPQPGTLYAPNHGAFGDTGIAPAARAKIRPTNREIQGLNLGSARSSRFPRC